MKNKFFTRRFVSARYLTQSRLCAKSSAEMEIIMIRGIKLLRYSYRLGMNCVAWAVCMACGVLACLIDVLSSSVTLSGVVLLAMGGVFLLQIWCNLNAAGLVKGAPARKAMHTVVPAVLCMSGTMLGALLIWAFYLVRYATAAPEDQAACVNGLLLSAAPLMLLMIYGMIIYKCLVVGMVFFFISFFLTTGYGSYVLASRETQIVPLPVAVAVNLLAVPVGGVICYGISRLLCRKEVSKYSLDSRLRKNMG